MDISEQNCTIYFAIKCKSIPKNGKDRHLPGVIWMHLIPQGDEGFDEMAFEIPFSCISVTAVVVIKQHFYNTVILWLLD